LQYIQKGEFVANERGKHLDKTHLSIDQAEARGFIHRDYIAHCLRWSHVAKHLQQQHRYKTAYVLDIGCGKEVPLAKLMYSSRLIPETGKYVGIDANYLTVPDMFKTGKFPIELWSQKTFPWLELEEKYSFEVVTCFEVCEHVEPMMALQILQGIQRILDDSGAAFISTPCYDAQTGAAANHVNEMSHAAFGSMIERSGLFIENVWGTFASIKDYKDQLQALGMDKIFDRLRDYYDSNYLATVFAPLFPHLARNCLWQVTKHGGGPDKYEPLSTYHEASNSSSELWTDFVRAL
jgi:2-polyprenyl-3-methyl-5-hydroxy-6-metoxy-1,4-benzoquinol methylase